MVELKCLDRKVEKGVITEYLMCNRKGEKRVFSAEDLKFLMKTGRVSCINLTRTTDNRLILTHKGVMRQSPDAEQLAYRLKLYEQYVAQQRLGGNRDAEYIVDQKNRVLLKTVFVKNGIFVIPEFVSDIYSHGRKASPFKNCERLKVINNSMMTNMCGMFESSNLRELDLTEFDTSRVTVMSMMFGSSTKLLSIKGQLNTSRVVTMAQMFEDCFSLKEVDVSHFDTSDVRDMSRMFSECGNLTELDVRHWNTANVTTMHSLFFNCKYLRQLDLRSFVVSPTTEIYNMLYGCPYSSGYLLSADLEKRKPELK